MEIPAGLTDAAALALVVGFVQPFVLQFILQSKWSSRVQSLVAFAFSAVTGTLTALVTGVLDNPGSWVSTVLLVAVVSIASYKGFWKPVTPDLKAATSAGGATGALPATTEGAPEHTD